MRIPRMLAAVAAFFVIAVVVAGCGGSSVPSDSAATVAGNPITVKAFNHWMYVAAKGQAQQAAAQGQTLPVITAPDPPQFASCIHQVRVSIPTLAKTSDATLRSDCKQVFDQFVTEVMDYLIQAYWYQADAHKLGIHYTAKDQQQARAKLMKQVGSKQAYAAYLKASGQTDQDMSYQLRVSGIQAKLLKHWEKPVTAAAIAAYYRAHKSQFADPATVSGHLIRTKTQAQASAAVAALKSGGSWATVAKRYAEDSASKTSGGVITDVTSNQYEHAANTALFNSPVGKLVGPVKGVFGYYVLQLTKSVKGVQHSLADSKSSIKSTLTQQNQTKAGTRLLAYSKAQFGKNTVCASVYQVPDCSNYKAPKTTSTATPAPSTTTTKTSPKTTTKATGKTKAGGKSSTTGKTTTTPAKTTTKATGTATKAATTTTK